MILLYIAGLLAIFYILAEVCDKYFVQSLDIISRKLNLSEDVAGATFMAIGSSAPELFTALIALSRVGSEDIGAGTIVGSAIFNVLVIVGLSSVVATAYLSWKPVIRDLIFYIFSILILLFTFQDGTITLSETLIYLVAYSGYLVLLRYWGRFVRSKDSHSVEREVEEYIKEEEKIEKKSGMLGPALRLVSHTIARTFPDLNKNKNLYWLTFVISIVYIAVMSFGLVELAILIAHELSIPEVVIALTILAGGTSIPDLLSSVIVAKQGRGDMAVSNAVGSNTFDILIGLGLPWFLYTAFLGKDVIVGTENLFSSILLLFFTVITLLFLLITQKFKIGYKAGYFLLGIYIMYVGYSIYGAYVPEAWTIGEFLSYAGETLGVAL